MGISVGDRVVCKSPGSWVDGREATVEQLEVTSSDGITGCLLRVPKHGLTVVPPSELEKVEVNQ